MVVILMLIIVMAATHGWLQRGVQRRIALANRARATSLLASEYAWIISDPDGSPDGRSRDLPLEPALIADLPDATGQYRLTATSVPGLSHLTLTLRWTERGRPVQLEHEVLVADRSARP
ncbi:hypothetical protein HS125_06465 [bacterium]|nr:hypothetical protein [bacterium]